MKTEPGYYITYRTGSKGTHLRILSRLFAAVQGKLDPLWLRQTAEAWLQWERQKHPTKDVILIQVLA